MLEEAEMRIQLAKKDIYEFKRDIVLGAEDVRSGKIMAEKMLKFLEEQLHSKDQLIDKLQLKNQVMRTQIGKIEQQLSQKEELGEVSGGALNDHTLWTALNEHVQHTYYRM